MARICVATHALCPFVAAAFRLPAAPLAHLRGPARTLLLGAAAECQRIGRDVLGDDAAGADIGPLPDLDRRHQRSVGADKGARPNLGPVLVEAVIVAGDGAGADVSAGADACVADISEVVNLGALADLRLLDLDEIADMRILCERGTWPQARERSDRRPLADPRVLHVTEAFDGGTVLDNDTLADPDMRLDHHVLADARVMAEKHRLGRNQRCAIGHDRGTKTALHEDFRLGELGARVYAEDLFGV